MPSTDVLLLCALTAVSGFNAVHCNDVGYFWQLTDLHVDLQYQNNSQCHGRYGHPLCDSPLELVQSAINATKTLFATVADQNQQPDFVVWSGDNAAHNTDLTTDDVAYTIQLVSRQLQRVFTSKNVYVLPVLGNHDSAPANRMSPHPNDVSRLTWCHRLASDPLLWGRWIHLDNRTALTAAGSGPPPANFSKGCFFSHLLTLPNSSLLLVSLNGLIWYQGNSLAGATTDPDPLLQLDWLQRTFDWARKSGYKVLLVSHFPPGASENTPRRFQFLLPHINKRFVNMLVENADVLMTGLFAHTHVDSFRVLSNQDGHPVLSLFIGPSVSPMRLSGLGSFNPRIRLYRYRRTTATLLGYRQFFLNISQRDPRWMLEYDSSDAYGLEDLSPDSMSELLKRLERDDAADGLWNAYWYHELGGRPHEPTPLTPDGTCQRVPSVCRCEHLCPMRYLDLKALNTCLASCTVGRLIHSVPTGDAYPSDVNKTHKSNNLIDNTSYNDKSNKSDQSGNQGSSLPIIIGVIIAFLVILVGVVLIVNREICRKRGRYTRRLVGSGGTIGGIRFTTVNGAYPVSLNGEVSRGVPHGSDHYNSLGGSSISFQPQQADNHSVSTIHTADENMTSPIYGIPVKNSKSPSKTTTQAPFNYVTFGSFVNETKGDSSALFLSDHMKPRRPNGFVQPAAVISPTGRHSRSTHHFESDQMINKYPLLNPITKLNMVDRTSQLVSPSPIVGSPEDYYADDEAFGDDEEGTDLVNDKQMDVQSSCQSDEDDHEPFDDGNKPFRLDRPRISLAKSKPSRDWKFLKRQSMQSYDEPPNLSKQNGVNGSSVPNIEHVHSSNGTMDNAVVIPHSHSTGSGTMPSHNGSITSHSSPLPTEVKLNGSKNPDEHSSSSRRQSGYDYVRI